MNYAQAVRGMISGLFNMYESHNELLKSEILDAEDKEAYRSMREKLWHRENNNIEMAIPELCRLQSALPTIWDLWKCIVPLARNVI